MRTPLLDHPAREGAKSFLNWENKNMVLYSSCVTVA